MKPKTKKLYIIFFQQDNPITEKLFSHKSKANHQTTFFTLDMFLDTASRFQMIEHYILYILSYGKRKGFSPSDSTQKNSNKI